MINYNQPYISQTLTSYFQMHSSIQNRKKQKPSSQSIKNQRPKPQWTTDFVDRDQFKLSQAQMIEKKAALQSKHRQAAKKQLQQRRKKLEMGIIDDQTRKVYETALISKNIDINPPVRRNLTQMIRYEKERKQNDPLYQQQFSDEDDPQEGEENNNELREAQNFIRKFQKAKKQDKIQRAVQILTQNSERKLKPKINTNNSQSKPNNYIANKNSNKQKNQKYLSSQFKQIHNTQSLDQNNALSSIEETIRFMEEKLFAAKKTVDEHSKSYISEQSLSIENDNNQKNRFSDKEIVFPSKNMFKKFSKIKQASDVCFKSKQNLVQDNKELYFGEKIGQISQLRINLKDDDVDSENQCLDTIRRMREIMENAKVDNDSNYSKSMKQNIRDNYTASIETIKFSSTIQKFPNLSQSDAQVSFTLTSNNDQFQQDQSSLLNLSKSKYHSNNNFSLKNDQSLKLKPILKQKTVGLIDKQDESNDEYQKVKQNLFNCINNNQNSQATKAPSKPLPNLIRGLQKYNQDSDEDSQDSLLVREKINMWKSQLQHQQEPLYQDQQTHFELKSTTFNKKNNSIEIKILPKHNQQNQDQSYDDDQTYKYNYLTQKAQNINNSNKNRPENLNNQLQQKATNQSIKKPPIVRKRENNQKFEEMKKMLSNASSEIQKIQIQPLKIQPMIGSGQVMGFDFRGSINIKKNVIIK